MREGETSDEDARGIPLMVVSVFNEEVVFGHRPDVVRLPAVDGAQVVTQRRGDGHSSSAT
jgi:hypothetical protein